MKPVYLMSLALRTAPLAVALAFIPEAHAVEPLEEFIVAAREQSFAAREQEANVDKRHWEKKGAFGRLLPSFSARGILQYNEHEVLIPQAPTASDPSPGDLIISPQVQTDAIFQIDVPLVDLISYHRYNHAKHLETAAQAQKELVGTEVDRAVARAYYIFVGASALELSADRAVALAEQNESLVKSKLEMGIATELDLARATANTEKSRQDRADAGLGRSLAARTLQTLTGRMPSPVTEYPVDDLRHEKQLGDWLAVRDTPSDKLHAALTRATGSARKAARAGVLPMLSAHANERLSNATGFPDEVSTYTLQAVLSWRLDYGTYTQGQALKAQAEIQTIDAERARRTLEDNLYEAYQRVEAGITKSAASRAQVAAANRAAELALIRYEAGALTQLDVTQSQKDAFLAQASNIQADADLLYSRALLRILSGLPIETSGIRTSPKKSATAEPSVSAAAPAPTTTKPASPAAASPAPTDSPSKPIAP